MKTLLLSLVLVAATGLVLPAQNGYDAIPVPVVSASNRKTAFYADNAGNVYIGYSTGSLAVYHGGTWDVYNEFNSCLSGSRINAITTFNNEVYIGTNGGLLNFSTCSFMNGLVNNQVTCLTTAGSLYVGTNGGISIYNGTSWSSLTTANSGLISDSIHCIVSTSAAVQWIGTRNGVSKKNGAAWTNYDSSNGLPGDDITSITVGPFGNIWLGSMNGSTGIYKFNGSTFDDMSGSFPDVPVKFARKVSSIVTDNSGNVIVPGSYYDPADIYGHPIPTLVFRPDGSVNIFNKFPLEPARYALNLGYRNAGPCFVKTAAGDIYFVNGMSDFKDLYKLDLDDYIGLKGLDERNFRYLDINNIKAGAYCANSMFWDMEGRSSFEVPKGSGKHTAYNSNLWLCSGNRVIGDRYLSSGRDTWPGPLTIDGTAATDSVTSAMYDRIWKVSKAEIDNLIFHYSNGTLNNGTYSIPKDILEWPVHGPSGYSQQLAPFYDSDGNGVYDPFAGDYPLIKGSQMLYWILNDRLSTHGESSSLPLGVEIHVSLYACSNDSLTAPEPVNNTVFIEYEIINRGTNQLDDLKIGLMQDNDIGHPMDDMMGSFVDQQAFYFYNGDNYDEDHISLGYGSMPPVQSTLLLRGPDDGNGNPQPMDGFSRISQGFDPVTFQHICSPLHQRWMDGTHQKYGGDGYNSPGTTTIDASYLYPGDSDPAHTGTNGTDPGFAWTELNTGGLPNAPGERRGIASFAPAILVPGASTTVSFAMVTTFGPDSADRIDLNRQHNALVRNWFDNNSLPCHEAYTAGIDEEKIRMSIFPNPASGQITVQSEMIRPGTMFSIIDISGRILQQGTVEQYGYVQLQTGQLIPGYYIVRLDDGKGKTGNEKFVRL